MKMTTIHLALLGAVIAPAVLLGQINNSTPNQPGSMQPGTMQPNGTNPTGANGTGMAGAMTAGSGANPDQTVRDRMFLRKAAEGGMAEVQLGQLAAQKGSSDDVKAFGQKMVTDHTQLNNDIKPIADQMGVMLPKKLKKDDQAEYDKLSAMAGEDFDKEYLTFMVKDHHADLREFRQEDMAVQDPTLKAAVDKGLGVIREHTQMVDKLAKDKGIPVPQRGGRQAPPTN